MLYRYLWLPIEQYSEREMNSLSFDTLLKYVRISSLRSANSALIPADLSRSYSLSLGYHTRRKTGELLRILGRTDAINNVSRSGIPHRDSALTRE